MQPLFDLQIINFSNKFEEIPYACTKKSAAPPVLAPFFSVLAVYIRYSTQAQ